MSMELSNYLVSWVITYLRDLQPTFTGVIIHLLGTMDIQVYTPLPKNSFIHQAPPNSKLHSLILWSFFFCGIFSQPTGVSMQVSK